MKNKLIEVLTIQSESYNQYRMFAYIVRQLKAMRCSYYTYNGSIYATKGNALQYPCIASHMDTVHNIVEDLTPINIKGNITGFNSVTMEQTGIGGDDKVGIFIALQCLETFDNMKAVFFRDEEVGCEGSYDADKTFFNNCNFVLQCDRRGNKDFVINASNTPLSSDKFQSDVLPIISKYGYSFSNGMMTDVMALKESGILCSMANISCGYYNPHCSNEYVNTMDVFNCLEMVIDIMTEVKGEYPCKYKKSKSYYRLNKTDWYGLREKYSKFMDDENTQEVSIEQSCECCSEIARLTYVSEYNIEMCERCIDDYIKI